MSKELQELILEYFRSEVLPDRKYLVDDCDLARIIDLMKLENLI